MSQITYTQQQQMRSHPFFQKERANGEVQQHGDAGISQGQYQQPPRTYECTGYIESAHWFPKDSTGRACGVCSSCEVPYNSNPMPRNCGDKRNYFYIDVEGKIYRRVLQMQVSNNQQ